MESRWSESRGCTGNNEAEQGSIAEQDCQNELVMARNSAFFAQHLPIM